MKRIITFFCVLGAAISLTAQSTIPEALNMAFNKETLKLNSSVDFIDATKKIILPQDGMFLYSSLNNKENEEFGYANNENYVITITDANKRTLWLRSQYFALADSGDVLKIYDGGDTLQPLLAKYSGVSFTQEMLVSRGHQITLHFRSNSVGASKGFRFRVDGDNNKVYQTATSCSNTTPAADACTNAPLICNLNGYCGNTSGQYTADHDNPVPPGFCGSIENNSWLSFIASSSAATFQFTSGGCQDANTGIQAIIYSTSNCSNFTQVSNCVSQSGTSGSFNITTNTPLVPGNKYYIMIDGYAGNVCNYTVTAQSGVATNPQISANPTQICAGSSTTLTASTPGTTYTWTASDGTVLPNTQSVQVTPVANTTYSLLVGPNACAVTGGTAAITVSITTTLPPPNISAPATVCNGNSATLNSSTNGGTFNWTGPNGFTSNLQNPTIFGFTSVNAGTYTLVITYGAGCATQPATVTIGIAPSPNISLVLSPSNVVCQGTVVNLTASGGSTNPLTPGVYNWTWNAAQTTMTTTTCFLGPLFCAASASNPQGINATKNASAFPNQTTQVCVSSTSSNGCVGQACQVITVLSNTGSLTVASVTTCPTQSITLTASGASSYTWSPATGLSSTNGATVSANPATTTNYTVTGDGCGGSALSNTVDVTVLNIPPAIGNMVGSATVCPNQSDNVYSVNNLSGTTYSWTVPAGAVITSTSSTTSSIKVDFGGTAGTVSVSASNACGTSTAMINVVTNNITVTASANPTSFCSPGSSTLTTSGAYWYDIQPTNGLATSSGTTTTFVASPTVTTSYTITGNTGACINNTVVTINVGSGGGSLNVSSSTSICPGNTVALTATGSTGNYTWSPATAISGSVNNASVTANPTTTTIYTVSAPGCTGIAINTVQVTVGNSIPLYTVTTNSATICLGQSAILTATANGIATYSWSTGSSLNPLTVTPTVTTTYTVTDNTSCPGQGTITITVNSTPVLAVSSPTSVCTGGSVTISATGGTGTYTWSPASGIIGSANTASVDVNPATTTVYTVTAPGCSGIANNTVQVSVINPLPVIVANPTVICSGGSTTLTATGANSYAWTGTNLSTINGSVTVASPGSTSTYTVTGAIGACTNTAVQTVVVSTSPVYTVTASSATICAGQSAVLTATANGIASYSWNTGAVQNPLTVSPSTTTSYTVTDNSPCPGHGFITITVSQPPNVSISSALICAGETTTLSASGTATSYTWTAGNGTSLPHTATVSVSPSSTTTYTLTGSNVVGCSVSNTTTVTVNAPHASFSGMPNATETIGTILSLQSTSTGASNVAWLTCYGSISTFSSISVPLNDEGTCCVTLYAYEGSCIDSVTQCVNVVPKARLIVPNVFTPNGDGRNDNFTLDAIGIGDITIAIFDRWGLKMFETSTTGNIKWDGKTKNGALVPDGTYFYMLKATGLDGESYDMKGTINVFQ